MNKTFLISNQFKYCIVAVFFLTNLVFSQSYSGGSGTSSDPYRIATVQDLITLSRTESHWSASTVDYNNIHKYFLQTADIVFNSNPQLVDWNNDGLANWSAGDQKGFNPIGRGAYGAPRYFTGSYDGGNYSITNLYINLTATAPTSLEPHDAGMFGYIFSPGVLKNIHLKNADVSSLSHNIGALVGYLISANNYHVAVNNCSSSGTVSGYSSAGGLVGYSHTANIINSYSSCNVTTTGNYAVGGLVGSMNYNFASLKNCFSTGTVTGNYSVGGLVGALSSYSGKTSELSNCYSTSNVTGYDYVGGLIGYLGQDTNVFNSYSTGAVLATAVNPKKGGLIGYISPYDPNITSTNCFWDTENSGLSTSYGTGAAGKTTTQMKTQVTYSGWNFAIGANNWSIQSGAYISYPYLQRFSYDTPGAIQSVNPIPGLFALNQAPTDISLSATTINENSDVNSIIGSLTSTDSDAGNTFTYTLVNGSGDTDNASFNIFGSNLRLTASLDFETKNTYNVRIRTTDQSGAIFEKTFIISVNDINEAPTNISLSTTTINENSAVNSTIGSLISADSDAGNTFTYTLVSGSGDTDNASFSIAGSNLRLNTSLDFETKNIYSVRIRITDQGSLSFEKSLTINVSDVNETPTDISLSATTINENVAANSIVGTLTSIDSDAGNTFTYTLVSGSGSTDNGSFSIVGGNLRLSGSPDYEIKNNYSVRIRTTDQGGLSYEKVFTILINNVDESPILSLPQANYSGIINVALPTINVTNSRGVALSFAISPSLPSGLFFNSSTGSISGLPTISMSSTSYSISATNSDGTGTISFTLFIDLDTDSDGIGNNTDPDIDGDGIINSSDSDVNGDGTLDNGTDTDTDGINDANDSDIDGDGIINSSDSDVNGDGTLDNGTDTDTDGINDANDPDIDGDGVSNTQEAIDGTNPLVLDTDGDGVLDVTEKTDRTSGVNPCEFIVTHQTLPTNNSWNTSDCDYDGVPNAQEIIDGSSPLNRREYKDTDNDGIPDYIEQQQGTSPTTPGAQDTDGDGVPDYIELQEGTNPNNGSSYLDTDNDGLSNYKEGYNYRNPGASVDTDRDGTPDYLDRDADGDGILDRYDAFPTNKLEWTDTDRDGIGNNADTDDDNDGILDSCDVDTNSDGIPDNGTDLDGDGINDDCDPDKDGDGVNNTSDNCPNSPNTDQADRDRDGKGDVCDTIEINVSQAITPNGDGVNDTWVIYNLGNHPGSIVRVFNANGTQVFYSANYQNNWMGNYQGSNESLPVGSYLYQIDLGGDGSIDAQGWLYITQ